jgi:pyrroline-5-carboxylate reductase
MRDRVTSKGGTTEAAFKVFKSKKIDGIIRTALKKAAQRSKKLSRG